MNAPWPTRSIDATPPEAAATTFEINLENVGKVFPERKDSKEVHALVDVNLRIEKGSIVGVIGRSGAGKSTLIRLVNGLERPSTGRVIIDGIDIAAIPESGIRAIRRNIGMIFQHFNLLSSRTVYDNIALPLEIAGSSRQAIKQAVDPLLELVGLGDKRNRYPAELSGGQKQRVGIARALATQPHILLSDEATSALDPETTEQILSLLKRINRELGLTVLFITHEMAVVKALADRVAVIERGRIVEEGSTFDLFSSPQHEVTRRFVSVATSDGPPDWLLDRLVAHRKDDASAVLHVAFRGEASQSLLFRLSRQFEVDPKVLAGHIETIGGQIVGATTITLKASPALLDAIIEYLKRDGNRVEHLGYVY